MVVKGKELLLGGPVVKGKEVSWMVESQTNSKKAYTVCITPKPLKKYKAKRDSYKNFSYKCTCENFKVFVLTNSKIMLSNYKKITQTECRAQPQTCGIELNFFKILS